MAVIVAVFLYILLQGIVYLVYIVLSCCIVLYLYGVISLLIVSLLISAMARPPQGLNVDRNCAIVLP